VPLNPHLLDSSPSDPIFLFWARLWDFISQIVHLQALSFSPVSAFLSSYLLNSVPQALSCPFFKASLNKSFHQVSLIFYLDKSPITMNHFEKSSHFSTWASCPLQWDHFENLALFHRGKLSIIMKPFWKIFEFFTWIGHSLQWDHFEKYLYFFIWADRLLQWDHFEKSLHFSYRQVTHNNEIILKNLRSFHMGRSPNTMRSLWKI